MLTSNWITGLPSARNGSSGEISVVAATAEEGIATIQAELARMFGDEHYLITAYDARGEVSYAMGRDPSVLCWSVTASVVTSRPVRHVPAAGRVE